MARKRLNKNLVAFLTVMGILLSVAVVAVATYQNASKDPEVYASAGRDLEQRGDSKRAVERYLKAYNVNNEAKYLIDAARCAYQIGHIYGSGAIGMLKQAHTQEPGNVKVLEILLGYYWELRLRLKNDLVFWVEMRKHADQLLELDSEHVDALIYRSTALAELVVEDSHNAVLSDEVLQQAIDLAPNAPLVALARANAQLVGWRKLAKAAAESGRSITGDPAAEKHLTAALDILDTSLEMHRNDYGLIVSVVGLLGRLGRSDELADVLRDAIGRTPGAGKLHLELGRALTGFIQKRRGDPARASEIEALGKEARAGLSRAIELDPALYDAHMLLAGLTWRDEDSSADPQQDLIRRGEASLTILERAIAGSVGLKSITAELNQRGRAMLHLEAFETALRYASALVDETRKSAVMERAETIYEQAKGQYAQWPVTHFMEGQLHRLKDEPRAAIQAFEMADRKTEGRWRLAREQLVVLYRQEKEYGRALKTLESVIELYKDNNEPVPLRHAVNKGGLLTVLDRSQEALYLAEDQLRRHPDQEQLLRIKAQALTSLGRTDEAQRTLESAPGQSDSLVLDMARMAASAGDYARAETKIRALLAENPDNMPAVNLLVRVLIADGRRADAEQAVVELRTRVKDASMSRYLSKFSVVLGAPDDATRDAKLLELIRSYTDPFTRYGELYNFYISEGRRDLSKAEQNLKEMIKLRPDSAELIDKQFALALAQKDFAAAEGLAAKLTAIDADLCGGATYRGRLELARGNPEASVAELRSAERQRPSDSFLKTLVAQALLASPAHNADEAIETLKAAVEINPLSFRAHAMLFRAYGQLGNREAAIEHLKVATKLNPSNSFVKANQELVDEQDNPQRGIARRENLRKTNPDDVDNLLRLADLYVRTADGVRAEECLTAALDQAPTSFPVVQAAAGFYGDSGRREDAERVVRAYQAQVEGLDKVYACHLLASVAEQLDDHTGAYEFYREARTLALTLPTDGDLRRQAIVEVSFRTGDFCSRRGLADEALESYRAGLANLKPSQTSMRQRAMLLIIDGLLAKRSLGDAEQEINAFRREFPDEPRGLVTLAELQIRRKEYHQAIAVFSELLAKNADPGGQMHAYALYRRGSLYHDVGNYTSAKADLLEAKRAKPNAFGLKHRLALARVYETTQENALAESELREIIPLYSDYRTPADRLINMLRRTGQFEKGQRIAREYMNKYPDRTFWPYALGSLLMDRGEASAAVEPLRRAVELSLVHNRSVAYQVHWKLLTAMVRAGRQSEAINAYEAIEAELMWPSVRARGAEAYYRSSQSERALELLEKAVHEGASHSWGELLRVLTVADGFLPDEGVLSLFKRLSEQQKADANSARYDAAYVQILILNEVMPEAAKLIESVVARTAPGTPWRIAVLQLRASLASDDPVAQRRAYELVLEEDPDSVVANNNLALLLAEKLNRPKEGLKYAERANELMRRAPNILDTLGWVRFLNGQIEEAEQALLEAVMLQPDSIAAHYHLGRVHAERGRRVKARQEYEVALRGARATRDAKYEKLVDEALKKLP